MISLTAIISIPVSDFYYCSPGDSKIIGATQWLYHVQSFRLSASYYHFLWKIDAVITSSGDFYGSSTTLSALFSNHKSSILKRPGHNG